MKGLKYSILTKILATGSIYQAVGCALNVSLIH